MRSDTNSVRLAEPYTLLRDRSLGSAPRERQVEDFDAERHLSPESL
jgi:hypothetical protein